MGSSPVEESLICCRRGALQTNARQKAISAQLPKNKTHKKLTRDMDVTYKARVTKVTAFETDKGIGNRYGDALDERKGRRLLIL